MVSLSEVFSSLLLATGHWKKNKTKPKQKNPIIAKPGFSVSWCYGLSVCVPLKFMLKPNAQ